MTLARSSPSPVSHSLCLRPRLRSAPPPAPAKRAKFPVIKISTSQFGFVLARRNRLPLYYWTPEKQDRQVHCVNSCAVVWPPVIVRAKAKVARKVKGFKGRFGTIKRPDGRRQLIYKRLPLYSYHNDPPSVVLCNDVDGLFVVKA